MEQSEKELLKDHSSEIIFNAECLTKYYFLESISKIHKIEGCVFIEVNKLGFNFLSEIEKGNYENRKIARCVNLYKNYFKAKTSGKSEPQNSFASEVFLSY